METRCACRATVPWLAAVVICAVTGWAPIASGAAGPSGDQPSQRPRTIAAALDFEISAIEKQILEAAEAMPESRFNFSPESLRIPGDDYQGVRTFALQVRHVAASNYALWAPLTGDAADARTQHIVPFALGDIRDRPRIGSLRTDGGVTLQSMST